MGRSWEIVVKGKIELDNSVLLKRLIFLIRPFRAKSIQECPARPITVAFQQNRTPGHLSNPNRLTQCCINVQVSVFSLQEILNRIALCFMQSFYGHRHLDSIKQFVSLTSRLENLIFISLSLSQPFTLNAKMMTSADARRWWFFLSK